MSVFATQRSNSIDHAEWMSPRRQHQPGLILEDFRRYVQTALCKAIYVAEKKKEKIQSAPKTVEVILLDQCLAAEMIHWQFFFLCLSEGHPFYCELF